MTNKKRWSQEQIDYLIKNHKDKSILEMSEDLGKTKSSIRSKCGKLHLSCYENNNKKSYNKDIEFIKNNKDMDFTLMCITLNKSHRYVRKLRSELGIETLFKKNTKKWSEDEKELLKNNYGKKTRQELAKILNRSIHSILAMAFKLRLNHFDSKYSHINKSEFIDLYINQEKSILFLSEKFNISRDDVYTLLDKWNIPKRTKNDYLDLISGKNNHNWKGSNKIPGAILSSIVCRARSKNIEVSISIEDLEEIFIKQEGKCVYSGFVLTLKSKKSIGNASVDRIDSSKGYTKDNIQWVHKDINFMKQNFTEEHFLKMCSAISKYRKC